MEPNAETVFTKAVADTVAALEDLTPTDESYLKARDQTVKQLTQVAIQPVHESKELEAAQAVAEFKGIAVGMLSGPFLDRQMLTLKTNQLLNLSVNGGWSTPPRVLSQYEKWDRETKWLCWGGDADLLWRFLRPDETIIRMTWQQVETDKRTLTRVALRLMDRPSYSTVDPDAWVSQYGPILEPRD
jgi:hypothetical protein